MASFRPFGRNAESNLVRARDPQKPLAKVRFVGMPHVRILKEPFCQVTMLPGEHVKEETQPPKTPQPFFDEPLIATLNLSSLAALGTNVLTVIIRNLRRGPVLVADLKGQPLPQRALDTTWVCLFLRVPLFCGF